MSCPKNRLEVRPWRSLALRRYAIWSLACLFVLVASTVLDAAESDSDLKLLPAPPQPTYWFSDLSEVPQWDFDAESSQGQGEALALYLVRRLIDGKTPKEVESILPEVFDPAKNKDAAEVRMVAVSYSDGRTTAKVVLGSGKGYPAAIDEAVDHIRALKVDVTSIRQLKLDCIIKAVERKKLGVAVPLKIDPTLIGVAYDKDTGLVMLPEELVAWRIFTEDHYLQPLRVRLLAKAARDYRTAGISLTDRLDTYLFTTRAFYARFNSKNVRDVQRLYRGHRWLKELNNDILRDTIKQAATTLADWQEDDGSFRAQFDPALPVDTSTLKLDEPYSAMDHALAVSALAKASKVLKNDDVNTASQRGGRWLTGKIVEMKAGSRRMGAVVDQGEILLRTNAAAVIALMDINHATGSTAFEDKTRDLATWLGAIHRKTGDFALYRQTTDGKIDDLASSREARSQALYAMAELTSHYASQAWEEAAQATLKLLILREDTNVKLTNVPHDAFLLLAVPHLNWKQDERWHKKVVTRVVFMAEAILQEQMQNAPYPDWTGSLKNQVGGVQTAFELRGLIAADRFLSQYLPEEKRNDILRPLRQGMEEAARFLVQLLHTEASVMAFEDPSSALGGFRINPIATEYRLGSHAMQLLALTEYLQWREEQKLK